MAEAIMLSESSLRCGASGATRLPCLRHKKQTYRHITACMHRSPPSPRALLVGTRCVRGAGAPDFSCL
ncbi:hypothetical protein DQZ69_09565 [Salmonella enterica subsp. enterica serovar Newport]|nr:hypothetical protein [Salmonella enterica subsp. enterica serovar Newport]